MVLVMYSTLINYSTSHHCDTWKQTERHKMARRKSKQGDQAAEAQSETNNHPTELVEDELELLQVDLGDMVKLKQVLDEAVASAVLEHVDEEYSWDNFKLLVMFLACCFAMVAQFAPIPFPESRPVLGVCGSAYFLLSGILQFIITFVDKDTILLTKPVSSDDTRQEKRTNKMMKEHGLRVRSSLPRFSEWYSVSIEFQAKEKNWKSPLVEQTWSVGQFFDKEGYFDEVGLSQAIDKVFGRFESERYNTVGSKSKTD